MSPALAGGFLTTVPPGKPQNVLNSYISCPVQPPIQDYTLRLVFYLFIYYFNKFIYFILFIFGCVWSSLLHVGFL